MKIYIFIILIILGSCIKPTSKDFFELNSSETYLHNSNCFTQGITFYKGFIYESCGIYGNSYIAKYKLGEEKYKVINKAENRYFYEGLTIHDDIIYVLTWKSGEILLFDSKNLEKIGTKKLPKTINEGWGLTNNGSKFYVTNGSNIIYELDKDFTIKNKLVTTYKNLNELEYINGNIYANIWKKNSILVYNIDTRDETLLEFTQKKNIGEKVLNGIAYNNGNLYLTGKKWDKIYEIKK